MADIRECRRKIDKIDSEISRLLDARRDALEDIAHYKKKNNIPVFDENREQEIFNKINVNDGMVFRSILDASKEFQEAIIKAGTFGLISEKPIRSLSPLVHSFWGDYEYKLCPTRREKLGEILKDLSYDGFNVTMPYKELVFSMCQQHSPECFALGNVNTIKRELDGTLTGYNTDYFGFKYILEKNKIDVLGKKVVILGTGGAAKTCEAVCKDMGAANIYLVSRTGPINYENPDDYRDVEVLVNCTPVGMYPSNKEMPIDIRSFDKLEAVVDIIYNPYRTKLILAAEKRGLKTATGLEMLVAQAGKSAEIFCRGSIEDGDIEEVIDKVLGKVLNRCLIGMPGAGKSFMGRRIANVHQLPFVDTDAIFEQRFGQSPADYISEFGQDRFRIMESNIYEELAKESGQVIACGGGIVEMPENLEYLRQNGVVIWVKRSLDKLSKRGRPISQEKGLEALYKERAELYESWSDFDINNNVTFKKSVLVINGPNMNLLGTREPEIYGTKTYDQLVSEIEAKAGELDMSIEVFQSNYEGEIIEKIQESNHYYDGIIINGAGYSYTSVAILDALRTLSIPVIEVHLSDIEKREEYRRESLFTEVARNSISGEGFDGYFKAMEELNG